MGSKPHAEHLDSVSAVTTSPSDGKVSTLPNPSDDIISSDPPTDLPIDSNDRTTNVMSYMPHAQQALAIGGSATDYGFQIAKSSTQFGFSISRKIIGTVFDTLSGVPPTFSLQENESSQSIVSTTINAGISLAEWCAIQSIGLGQQISKTSLDLASSTVSRLDGFYKAHLSDQYTTFKALKLFVKMIRKQWREEPDHDPPGGISQFGILDILKSLSCWALLQNLTSAIYSKRIIGELKEISLSDLQNFSQANHQSDWTSSENGLQFVVDQQLKTEKSQIDGSSQTDAEIITGHLVQSTNAPKSKIEDRPSNPITSDQLTLMNFKSYAGLCSSSYGGIGYLMFGSGGGPARKSAPKNPKEPENSKQEEQLLDEKEKGSEELTRHVGVLNDEKGESTMPGAFSVPVAQAGEQSRSEEEQGERNGGDQAVYRTWDLLTGKHDRDLLQDFGELHEETTESSESLEFDLISETSTIDWYEGESEPTESKPAQPEPAHLPSTRQAPRYFILTDHAQKKVILCLRGTFSIDDLATDLTCEYQNFNPTSYWDDPYPGTSDVKEEKTFKIHSGFAEVAQMIGNSKTGALTKSLFKVLRDLPGYKLDLVGHSLGAGVACILALMWAELSKMSSIHSLGYISLTRMFFSSPRLGTTTSKGGLPIGVPVKVYGIAPPCSVSAQLSTLSRNMIKSFVHSTDAVSRLSLGHILDLKTVSAWICHSEALTRQEQQQQQETTSDSRASSSVPKAGIWENVRKYHGMKDQILKQVNGVVHEEMKELEQILIATRKTLEANLIHAEQFPPGEIFWYISKGSDLKFPKLPLSSSDMKKLDNSSLGDEDWSNENGRLFKVIGNVEKVFDQMIFSREMLTCHLPQRYLKVIQDEI
ncbi:lipase class 3 [Melampsora larici-populina 98AG31]|uniref:sn-1-specific diacylglycerol lipase n=1 Tax=Melampsora larici-populina (strain 98AG31 / pathotype 3-4-7) TaxID=747676 RepID=F4RM73_MELLP|nr:lipase class 3 [Melampsora larici-populina 98AG31]EGG06517.1 lipase class 3 [Melampsora larici-populina 98AG31]